MHKAIGENRRAITFRSMVSGAANEVVPTSIITLSWKGKKERRGQPKTVRWGGGDGAGGADMDA